MMLPSCALHPAPSSHVRLLTGPSPTPPHSGGHVQGGSLYASALSALGLVYGTTERGRDFYSLYLEPAFISTGWYNATLLNLVDDPAAPGAGAHCRAVPLLLLQSV